MEWVKLSAVPAYYVDGALLRAGEAAEVLFCRGLAHCGGVESGGLIDKTVLPLLVQPRAQARADALVREGLWLDEGAHYRVRSWDKWQDQHDAAAEKKRKDRERQREHRRKTRTDESRDRPRDLSQRLSRDSHSDKRDCHNVEGEGEGEKDNNQGQTLLLDGLEPAPQMRPSVVVDASGFQQWYDAYPLRKGRAAAEKAYVKALRTTGHLTLLAAAVRFAQDPTRDPSFTPHPATWLNQGRWEDEGPARPQSNVRPMTTRVAEGDAILREAFDRGRAQRPELGA